MRVRNASVVVPLTLFFLFLPACTNQPKSDTVNVQESAPVIADPTPPIPPNSSEVPADLKNMPTFLFMAIGGIGSEGEKEGIEVQENMRLFRTNAPAQEVVSFYARAMKDRGWTSANQVARSSTVGLSMQEYRRGGSEALYLIISEPEDPQSSDDTKSKRYVALLPARLTKPRQ
jgi:hypothetical protein